jgi:hypothetical protein
MVPCRLGRRRLLCMQTLTSTSSSHGSIADTSLFPTQSTAESSDIHRYYTQVTCRSPNFVADSYGARISNAWFNRTQSFNPSRTSTTDEGMSNRSAQVPFAYRYVWFIPSPGLMTLRLNSLICLHLRSILLRSGGACNSTIQLLVLKG